MLKDLLTIEIKFSQSHLVFPGIIRNILILLGGIILIKFLINKLKNGGFKDIKFRFFIERYDKLKFFGTIGLLVAYVVLLEYVGFLLGTIAFVFLASLLFIGNLKRKTLIIALVNSLATSYVFWYIFGQVINITLP